MTRTTGLTLISRLSLVSYEEGISLSSRRSRMQPSFQGVGRFCEQRVISVCSASDNSPPRWIERQHYCLVARRGDGNDVMVKQLEHFLSLVVHTPFGGERLRFQGRSTRTIFRDIVSCHASLATELRPSRISNTGNEYSGSVSPSISEFQTQRSGYLQVVPFPFQ